MTVLTKEQVADDLKEFLVKQFPKTNLSGLQADDNLQEAGIDSLDSVDVMNHVEKAYEIKISRFEGSYFDTVNRIAELIISKQTA